MIIVYCLPQFMSIIYNHVLILLHDLLILLLTKMIHFLMILKFLFFLLTVLHLLTLLLNLLPQLTTTTHFDEIETILKRRTKKGVPECLFKWKGFSNKCNSWIPAFSIVDTGNIQPGPSTSQVSNISISSSPVQFTTMAIPKPKLNPWPYFLFSICFLASMSYLSTTPYLGPLYDCTKLHETSYF